MDKTLFITDLDGTLLNSDARVSSATVDIINALLDDGLLFTYATARSFTSANPLMKALRLNIPVITYNGAFIVNLDGKVIEACILDKAEIGNEIEKIGEKKFCPLVYAMIDGHERVSWLEGRENKGVMNYINSRGGDRRLRPVGDYGELFSGDIYYLTSIGEYDDMRLFDGMFKGNTYVNCVMSEDIYTKDEIWVEVYRHDARKDIAAKKIKALTGAERMICFGDNLNDIPLFRACDEKYAVGNANEEVRQIATAVIGKNDEDGVAKWIEAYFYSKNDKLAIRNLPLVKVEVSTQISYN